MLDYDKKVKRHLEQIKEIQTHKNNKTLFKDFNRFLHAKNHSNAHIDKLLSELKLMMKQFSFNFQETTREDMETIVGWINQRNVSDATKRQYKITLKKFYKWLNDGKYPKKVEWFETTSQRKKEKLPEQFLGEEAIKKMLEAANNPRDKAFIALLWESGARMGELHDMTVGSIENTENGMKATIYGETGPRRLTLIESVPYINTWIEAHPDNDNKDSPLWINIGNTNPGQKSGY
ncbi:MAG: XerD/XerC family integrase [Candidatus Methanohalarchaeum thermophilum]|uniref:XerD/XerC family integrase n=1 Tax=Methanohalarchaeum thermophilum TaxID=1903181 RepID=A0A1Q6DU42_METT1|nr:MAG: XerD/XerC family integrase [Candidatus Methanohalarchaeum thermophilum]